MLQSLYDSEIETQANLGGRFGSGVESMVMKEMKETFELIRDFLDTRENIIHRQRSRTPLGSLGTAQMGITEEEGFAKLCLRRRMEMKKEAEEHPKHLLALLSHIDNNISSLKEILLSIASEFAARTAEPPPSDAPPPLVHHDEGITLITNRLLLWERLRDSVSAVNEL
ncbi:hypothetical protein TrCOL_g4684 [Triparma columacea]|uniref:Uncharacterized protein n=1 Tax=Triparma columacea TaxID=722753 RepID=A0A9W7GLJ8_9STRA|nr:hypothetical protein TrCOL_g4684 [Triparma columacea]